jgi:hypothetical protein
MAKIRSYGAVVYFDDDATEFEIYGNKKRLSQLTSNIQRGYEIQVASRNRPDDDEWENDMVNGVLDSFKGTNWKQVVDIEY